MLIYGKNVAEEYLKKGKKIKKIIIQEGFNDKNIDSLLENKKFNIEEKSKYELDQLVNGSHQGIIMDVGDFEYKNIDLIDNCSEEEVVLILDHIEDPHNFGAIIRTAEAAGIKDIIIPKDRSVSVNSTVIKTSTGAVLNMNIIMVANLSNSIEYLKNKGFWVVGTALEDSVDFRSINYEGKIALVIGNEGSGMTRLTKEKCDFIAKIPMYGETNSLNASVASGVMIYEVLRQKGK
ncbi:MAG: 23S rRNA (guanosine(2251)-2'-O)-methyltransferase RlmB [Bacilli bacterium]|nr:23S rRNA (guanosine(2251)-2'-O)-methyltransferase RlmB [Bacilli bacterium]